mmetsp:Transcript_12309/g.34707  ORF Transcript_12309/g.34707 Transcript_12309/m.34707 type:complete len:233 (+) Transcript_12309:991-1689(+)
MASAWPSNFWCASARAASRLCTLSSAALAAVSRSLSWAAVRVSSALRSANTFSIATVSAAATSSSPSSSSVRASALASVSSASWSCIWCSCRAWSVSPAPAATCDARSEKLMLVRGDKSAATCSHAAYSFSFWLWSSCLMALFSSCSLVTSASLALALACARACAGVPRSRAAPPGGSSLRSAVSRHPLPRSSSTAPPPLRAPSVNLERSTRLALAARPGSPASRTSSHLGS